MYFDLHIVYWVTSDWICLTQPNPLFDNNFLAKGWMEKIIGIKIVRLAILHDVDIK